MNVYTHNSMSLRKCVVGAIHVHVHVSLQDEHLLYVQMYMYMYMELLCICMYVYTHVYIHLSHLPVVVIWPASKCGHPQAEHLTTITPVCLSPGVRIYTYIIAYMYMYTEYLCIYVRTFNMYMYIRTVSMNGVACTSLKLQVCVLCTHTVAVTWEKRLTYTL